MVITLSLPYDLSIQDSFTYNDVDYVDYVIDVDYVDHVIDVFDGDHHKPKTMLTPIETIDPSSTQTHH